MHISLFEEELNPETFRQEEFVVVDTETTGLRALEERIIEIAAVRIKGGRITEQFSRLIDPGRSIPFFITRLTGISDEDVAGEEGAESVMPEFMNFLGDSVFIAHNARFDMSFVNSELSRCDLPDMTNSILCTVRLARRILPALPSRSLKSLKRFFNVPADRAHRALDDAEATAKIFIKLINRMDADSKVDSLSDLLRYQYQNYGALGSNRQAIEALKEKIKTQAPKLPGVYFFLDRMGNIIYVGKAKNLPERLVTYFNGIATHTPKLRRLVKNVSDVDWQAMPSELAALIFESHEIKRLRPKYNVADTEYRQLPFIRLDPSDSLNPIVIRYEIQPDDAMYFGPFRNGKDARALLKFVQRGILTPLRSQGEQDQSMQRVELFLAGRDSEMEFRLEEEMIRMSDAMDFENAARIRDILKIIRKYSDVDSIDLRSVLNRTSLYLIARDQSSFEWLLIDNGHLEGSGLIDIQSDSTDRLAEMIMAQHDALSDVFGMTRFERVDEVRIVLGWLMRNRDQVFEIEEIDQESVQQGLREFSSIFLSGH